MTRSTHSERPLAYPLAQVSALSGIPLREVRAAIRRRELPCVEMSPRVRVVMTDDLEAWLRSRRSERTSA